MFGSVKKMIAKPDIPENNFPVSMIPWTTFDGFHVSRFVNELQELIEV